jgi:hypothetical protein
VNFIRLLSARTEVAMANDPGVFGGPEPDEQGTDLLGGTDVTDDEDELGGQEPDEEATDLLGGSDRGGPEDELGGPEEGGTDVLEEEG